MRNVIRCTTLLVSIATASFAQTAADAVSPEAGGAGATWDVSEAAMASMEAKSSGAPVVAQNWMVAAANPLAVEAGARVLQSGGSAADAMVAVQAVLGLVEPQSSGLGGGGYLLLATTMRALGEEQ